MQDKTKQALIIIILFAAAVAIAFPILAYMGVNSPLPFADWGLTIYTVLSKGVSATLGTIYGLVGATGITTAAAVAAGYAYNQLKKRANQIISTKEATITEKDAFIGEQATTLASVTKLKDDALATVTQKETEFKSTLGGYQTTIANMEGQLKNQTDQTNYLSKTVAPLLQAKTPSNTVFVDPANPNNKVIVVEKKEPYIT